MILCVSSDEITLKQQRDLGSLSNVISSTRYLPSSSTAPLSDATKDGHTTSDSSEDERSGPSLDANFHSLKK